VVCATHDEIDRVTEAIRSSRKRSGELGTGIPIGKTVSLDWTLAQKSDLSNLRPGQILVFHRAVKGIGKYEEVKIAKVSEQGVTVRNQSREERRITSKPPSGSRRQCSPLF
jgi:hypothetical protein